MVDANSFAGFAASFFMVRLGGVGGFDKMCEVFLNL